MQTPPNGFYQHYKHNPQGEPYNYMYEVIGIGRNTEDKTFTVLYRPLYENTWMPPADYQSRPLDMFLEHVEKDGQSIPRFIQIHDTTLNVELQNQKEKLYRNQ